MSILAFSSQVVRGHVGNSAAVPVLNTMGFEVMALPTVLLSHHPGHGRPAGGATPADDLAALVDSLDARGWLAGLDAVMTGYFADPAQIAVAARTIGALRAAVPALPVLVDPIIGDDGRVYVGGGVPEAIRDRLLPLATMATPNLFELGWLTGGAAATPAAIDAAARRLGPGEVVVTSVPGAASDRIATLAVTATDVARHETRRLARVPNGCGDTLAATYLGRRLAGSPPAAAMAAATQAVASLAAEAADRKADELPLIALRALFENGS